MEAILDESEYEKIYPITIVKDRYGGSYSKAKWLAFNASRDSSALDCSDEGDGEMLSYWYPDDGSDPAANIGRGSTPNEALFDLIQKIKGGATGGADE